MLCHYNYYDQNRFRQDDDKSRHSGNSSYESTMTVSEIIVI